MAWVVEMTDEARDWYLDLTDDERKCVAAAIDTLATTGPATGRPTVDTIKGSRHHNMKELRPRGGNLRALFAFDPRRTAIVLLGGDKTDDWTGWYDRSVPAADDLYDDYLTEIRKEGLI